MDEQQAKLLYQLNELVCGTQGLSNTVTKLEEKLEQYMTDFRMHAANTDLHTTSEHRADRKWNTTTIFMAVSILASIVLGILNLIKK